MKALKVSLIVMVWFMSSSFSLVPYDWKDQKMQFKLPDFFMTETSNDLAFVAGGNEMVFELNVYMDELVEEYELDAFVSKIGDEKYGLSQSEGENDINGTGFKGHYKSGIVDGKLVYVLGIRDIASGISYYGLIQYENADHADRTFAKSIMASLEKYF